MGEEVGQEAGQEAGLEAGQRTVQWLVRESGQAELWEYVETRSTLRL